MHEETLSRVMGVFSASFRSRFVHEKFVTFGVSFNTKDLGILRHLTESGKVVPAITKTYSLTESAAAYKYLATGHARGKIVITVD
jgi:NADPH:quinone reductase-like Zn-dependent oxidoreductase